VRPLDVLKSLKDEFLRKGGEILQETRYLSRRAQIILTSKDEIEAGHVVNAAGLYADKIAKDFGFSESYSIMPFKGLYIYCDDPPGTYRTHIYPVPNLKNPFLGVHFTLQTDGSAKIGPTAIPAFWREQYQGFENFKPGEFFKILSQNAALLVSSDFHFAQLAVEEISKYSRRKIVDLASQLVTEIDPNKFKTWGKPGIRAQLVNTKTRKLEMDFVIQGDKTSTHVLNAVSPAFTCCLPFAKLVCDRMKSNGMNL
jgi:L-2-hydroxyglutarate oxidase LhgO